VKAVGLLQSQFDHKNVFQWPSAFGGLGVISNRVTPDHWDAGGCYPWYDILVAAGDCEEAFLEMPDLRTKFKYAPGTLVAVCGKPLRHGVPRWSGWERLCYAHYLRGNVMAHLQQERAHWVKYQNYLMFMSPQFCHHLSTAKGLYDL
jgi:hypothetical protein